MKVGVLCDSGSNYFIIYIRKGEKEEIAFGMQVEIFWARYGILTKNTKEMSYKLKDTKYMVNAPFQQNLNYHRYRFKVHLEMRKI